jgi:polyisoprenoid-binding protein YceI
MQMTLRSKDVNLKKNRESAVTPSLNIRGK